MTKNVLVGSTSNLKTLRFLPAINLDLGLLIKRPVISRTSRDVRTTNFNNVLTSPAKQSLAVFFLTTTYYLAILKTQTALNTLRSQKEQNHEKILASIQSWIQRKPQTSPSNPSHVFNRSIPSVWCN
jgi:hypothetical protein